ncbi:ovarian cancer G-protein coupled receptor 1-like [Lepisosteus oculatus]|uniref:ovarian cancer G-protein coupled receptor 1-like n=1 Tax=Lepisosteus oculatus TaxID=7918 RepID=UPI0037184548
MELYAIPETDTLLPTTAAREANSSSSYTNHTQSPVSSAAPTSPEQCYQTAQILPAVIYIVVFCMGLPANCWALRHLYRRYRAGTRLSVYVLNLLLADFLQVAAMPTEIYRHLNGFPYMYYLKTKNWYLLRASSLSSVGFLVCITLESYLVIAQPAGRACIAAFKCAVGICLGWWVGAILSLYLLQMFWATLAFFVVYMLVFYLLPLFLLMYLCVGTRIALARAPAVPEADRRGAVGTLTLSLLILILIYSPFHIMQAITYFHATWWHLPPIFYLAIPRILSLCVVFAPLVVLFIREQPRAPGQHGTDPKEQGPDQLLCEAESAL